MKMNREMLKGLAALSVVALVAVACGGETPEDAEQPDAAEEASDAEEPAGAEEAGEPEGAAEDGEPFFAGEDIEFIVPFSAGGGADTVARFIADHLSRHVEGEPNILINNMPGGGTLEGFNYYARQDPDGFTIITSVASTLLNDVFDADGVEYSIDDLRPIGSFAGGHVLYARADTGIEQVSDLADYQEPLFLGATSPTGNDLLRLIGLEHIGIPDLQPIFGYEDGSASLAAVLQGELDLNSDTTSAYFASIEELVEEGEVVPLMTHGLLDADGEPGRDPQFPDLPSIPEAAELVQGEPLPPEVLEVYSTLMFISNNLNRVVWMHADAPDEAYEALAEGWEAMVQDPDFQAEVGEIVGDYDSVYGSELEAFVEQGLSVGPELTEWVEEFAANYE